MENLRFDKEGYFHVLVFYTGYFIKETENIFPRVYTHSYRNTRESLGEREIVLGTRCPHLCSYKCM